MKKRKCNCGKYPKKFEHICSKEKHCPNCLVEFERTLLKRCPSCGNELAYNVPAPITDKKECQCACHENKLKKPYEHDTQCCTKMNGFLGTDNELKLEVIDPISYPRCHVCSEPMTLDKKNSSKYHKTYYHCNSMLSIG